MDKPFIPKLSAQQKAIFDSKNPPKLLMTGPRQTCKSCRPKPPEYEAARQRDVERTAKIINGLAEHIRDNPAHQILILVAGPMVAEGLILRLRDEVVARGGRPTELKRDTTSRQLYFMTDKGVVKTLFCHPNHIESYFMGRIVTCIADIDDMLKPYVCDMIRSRNKNFLLL